MQKISINGNSGVKIMGRIVSRKQPLVFPVWAMTSPTKEGGHNPKNIFRKIQGYTSLSLVYADPSGSCID